MFWDKAKRARRFDTCLITVPGTIMLCIPNPLRIHCLAHGAHRETMLGVIDLQKIHVAVCKTQKAFVQEHLTSGKTQVA